MHTTWVELDRDALLHNVRTFRGMLGRGEQTAMMAVVKGNAYGHGMTEVARAIEAEIDWFGVNSIDEALGLRAAGCAKPTLILGASAPERQPQILRAGFRQVVYDQQTAALVAREAVAAGVRASVHLEVETGTNRLGARHEALCTLATFVRSRPSLELEGLFSHYANVEDTLDGSYADHQLGRFRAAVAAVEADGPVPIKHSAASAAAILFPQTYFTMARVGVGLYGLWPSEQTRAAAQQSGVCLDLRPVLTWKARLVHMNDVPFGEPVGYGCTYVATRPRRIGVIPVGYYEGLDRSLSNRGRVLVRGRVAPIVGRVAMNMTMIDVTDIPDAAVGDEVVIVGRQGERCLPAEDMAALLDTINYEVVTRIGASVPRVWAG